MTRKPSKIKLIVLVILLLSLPEIGYADTYQSLSQESFSAKALSQTNMVPSGECTKKNVGQVVVATDIDLTKETGEVTVALSNGTTWTKRGKLYPIEKKPKDFVYNSIVDNKEKYKDMFASDNISGAFFSDVPVGQNLTLYVYNQNWKEADKTIAYVNETSVPLKSACETKILIANKLQPNSKEVSVCVHSKDKSKDYDPKKTLTIPTQNTEIEKFSSENKDSAVSLGPCQDSAQVAQNVATGLKPQEAVSPPPSVAVNQVDPHTISNAQVQNDASAALAKLNEFRKSVGKSTFTQDPTLQAFADFRAGHLSKYTYAEIEQAGGHPDVKKDSDAKQIICTEEISDGTAPVWEVLAVNLTKTDSPLHRQGLIDSTGRIGITATTLKDGYILVVELSEP
jgi:hypothetical protein